MRHEMNRFLYPLVRDWKIYFCHDCVIECDDVKLHNLMYRSFEHGVINFRSDDTLNTNCINCSRMLNTMPTINKFFPADKNDISSVQGLLNFAHEGIKSHRGLSGQKDPNDYLHPARGKKHYSQRALEGAHYLTHRRVDTKLFNTKIHDSFLEPNLIAISHPTYNGIPMSTADREFGNAKMAFKKYHYREDGPKFG